MSVHDELILVPKRETDRIRGLSAPRDTIVSLFADACRINTLYMISQAGSGHVGSSLSAMDIVSLLYLDVMVDPGAEGADVYFSSKGHDVPGLYAVLIALGLLPWEQVHELRRMGGLPGHPDVRTPHIVTNTGSLGMGIAKAKGMVIADRLKSRTRRYYVLMGDGELQEGQVWESLQPAANGRFSEITVIVDHNKLQSDTFVHEVSGLGNLEERFRAHGWAVSRCNGHNIKELRRELDVLDAHDAAPGVLIADTVKGAGGGVMESTHFTSEQRLYAHHSGAPAPNVYASAVSEIMGRINARLESLGQDPLEVERVARARQSPPSRPERLVASYSDALVQAGERRDDLVVLDADLALDCGLLAFEKRWPHRFVECGIAEQDMVSQAGGLALNGALPVVHSFACFLSTRPNEQIYNNATEGTKILYVGSLAGLIPGGPGHSHQSVRDIAALAAIPGMVLVEPCCEREVTMATRYLVDECESSGYLRLVSVPCDIPYELPDAYRFIKGRGVALTEGEDIVLFSCGPVMLTEAFKASHALRRRGIGLRVVNLPWLNCFDVDWIAYAMSGCELVATLDNHYVLGGQGEMLVAAMAEAGVLNGRRLMKLGVREIPRCGRNDEVLKAHGLDAESLADKLDRFARGS